MDQYSHKPQGSCLRENDILKSQYDLQIIVPAYNTEGYLQQCMDSILEQATAYTYHVILIDDGSTDGTSRIAASYADDPRVTVIHQENEGFSGARNAGLKTLCAKYVMFCDSDDYLSKDAVQRLLDAAYRFDSDVVRAGYVLFDCDGRKEIKTIAETETFVFEQHCPVGGYVWGKAF